MTILIFQPYHLPLNLADQARLDTSFRSIRDKLPHSRIKISSYLQQLTTIQGVASTTLGTCVKMIECFDAALQALPTRIRLLAKYRNEVLELLFNRLIETSAPKKEMNRKFCVKLFHETKDPDHIGILIEKIEIFARKTYFELAKKFAPLAPVMVSSRIDKFRLTRPQRFEIAKMLPPIHQDYVDNFKLALSQRIELGIETARDQPKRLAVLKGSLAAIVEDGFEDGSDSLMVHGYRRSLFIYMLFLLCYNDNFQYSLVEGPPELQYLKGSKENDTVGCHSALIPNLVRKSNGKEDRTFSRHLYLIHAINSTIVHKRIVNEVDSALEGKNQPPRRIKKLRTYTIDIINKVADASKPSYTPEKGLEEFLSKTKIVAKDLRERVFAENDEKRNILAKELKGMCSILNPDKRTIQDEFFKMHALISFEDLQLKRTLLKRNWSDLSSQTKDRIFIEQQNDILSHTI